MARWPQDCPEEVARLVMQCLSASPSNRPTARDLALQLQGVAAGTSYDKSCSTFLRPLWLTSSAMREDC
eukprot:jgi/Botrbrau1/7549/Bobra.0159s0001.1